jgi:hypothetical protein
MQSVSWGKASWIGLIGACAAALAPVFSSLPTTWGATIAAVLAGITVIGRQMQAVVIGAADPGILIDEIPDDPTDTPPE